MPRTSNPSTVWPSQDAPFWVLAFYRYVRIAEAEHFAAAHLLWCKAQKLKGRILVADEGINGTLSGTPAQVEGYIEAMEADPRFSGTLWKIDPAEAHAFEKMHVRYRPEIVNSGTLDWGLDPTQKTGEFINGPQFRAMLNDPDVVLLDVRSNYETNLGQFKGARILDLENFRDLPSHLPDLEELKNKRVITYCTGGIKCEKASALLLANGFNDVGQLHGGVLQYARETGGEGFDGKLYVFDGRVAVDVNSVDPSVITKCCHCGTPTGRVVNCANQNCNAKAIICDDCGWEWGGTCKTDCLNSENRRPYDGRGYYAKPGVD